MAYGLSALAVPSLGARVYVELRLSDCGMGHYFRV